VQVRLPMPVDELLTRLAHERGTSKTQIVVDALECLEEQQLERHMEAGYRELAAEQSASMAAGSVDEQGQIIAAGLSAGLDAVPD
jgi:hypothetical protein